MCSKWKRLEAKSSVDSGKLLRGKFKILKPALHGWNLQRDLSDLFSCDSPPRSFVSTHLFTVSWIQGFRAFAGAIPSPEMLFFGCSLVSFLYLLWVFVPMLLSQETHPDNFISFLWPSAFIFLHWFFSCSTCYDLICILIIYSLLSLY